MADRKIRRALISVYDKTGIVDFARALHQEFGIEIISTGGTAKLLKDNGIPVTLVEQVTGFPEMMDGRVKTLHPKIHAAILADRDNPEHMKQLADQGIEPIDMVVVNLYPFEETVAKPDCTFEEAVEMIDIGGPCLLRAAAKNHKHVVCVSSPEQYGEVARFLPFVQRASGLRWRTVNYAQQAFALTQAYDRRVAHYLKQRKPFKSVLPNTIDLHLVQSAGMRYGENPHQHAGRFIVESEDQRDGGLIEWRGVDEIRAMSYNNHGDASAAVELCRELVRGLSGNEPSSGPAVCVFVKHTNACGVGIANDPIEAYRQAYLGDPNAAMGGVLSCSFQVTPEFAAGVMESFARWGKKAGAGGFFTEVWVAPEFEPEALETIRTAKPWGKRARLVDFGDMSAPPDESAFEYKTITGGILIQTTDSLGLGEDQWKVVTERQPTKQELADLRLAWLICKHTKSNAVTICADGMLIGNGAGQMSRVMSCRIATWLAAENGHNDRLPRSVAASDAFFPFRDGPDILMDAGVKAIIQPGGSKRDQDTIDACNEREVAMIFTGTRHFKH